MLPLARPLVRLLGIPAAVFLFTGWTVMHSPAVAAGNKADTEDYVREAMPPGFRVVNTELEGPVFADAQGRTLYRWPAQGTRNGVAGETANKPGCYDVPYFETAGLGSPYPAGVELPDADNRPTCTQHWPPLLAADGAKPVGNWTILDRTDGTKQWAYKEYALYTSHLDARPGETNGGSIHRKGRDRGGVAREPVGPASAVPAQFDVISKALGRLLVTGEGFSVYAYDKDTPTKSNCNNTCLDTWAPVLASDSAVARGEWSVIQRLGGDKQWAYRGMPLYTYRPDTVTRSYEGGDVPEWHNVFTQRAPRPPKDFQVADTYGGQVLADPAGKTIYIYACAEDTPDTLMCDAPDSPQVYRWAMCGRGDPERCLKTFPYVIADKDARSDSLAWSVRDIDPKSGRYVAAGAPGSLHVWAYRGRPIYTFAGDRQLGDIEADGWGQNHGQSNGFTAFWVRDAFRGNGGAAD